MNTLDHLVVTAPTLAAGVAWVEATLGVPLQPGGAHPQMGTHNALLRLGERTYLEVIAIDPAAPPPERPRWFGLDHLDADTPPRLATWVAATDDIERDVVRAAAAGRVVPMSRGNLNWRITVPEDGVPPLDGLLPALIEWPGGVHPAAHLPASGCRLKKFMGAPADAATLRVLLADLRLAHCLDVHVLGNATRPWLLAHIDTPTGPVRLGGPEQETL